MKLAFIPPIKHLELSLQGNMLMLLARQAIKYPHYINFFKHQNKYKILDNSVAEGEQVDEDKLLQIAKQLNVDEIVCIDKLYQAEFTEFTTESFINIMSHKEKKRFKLMAVPQADNVTDWLRCYKSFLDNVDIDVIGFSKLSIPKCFSSITKTDNIAANRQYLINYLVKNSLIKKPIHFLGLHNVNELNYYLQYAIIRSCDSNLVFMQAFNNIDISANYYDKKVVRNYFDRRLTIQQVRLAINNIQFMKQFVK